MLVVNGFINGNDSTIIRLSRSQRLVATEAFPPEAQATVYVESVTGQRYPLRQTKPGTYVSPRQVLPTGQSYRLRIRTARGREYASDYTLLKQTPPLDDLSGQIQPGGLQLSLSTHDEQGQTRYYRWEYEETWEFTSALESRFKYDPVTGTIVRRPENIYTCWRTEPSTSITTTSTVRLSQDAVRDFRLLFIPSSSGRLRILYSILVRQYALSQEEFDYWEAVKKNTQNIGTLFDPLPSQIQGNVHSLTDPTEPVLGFVGATTQVSQRIFIDRSDVPLAWSYINEGYEKCEEPVLLNTSGIPLGEYLSLLDYTPVGRETGQSTDCVDCRRRGSNKKPSFWR